MRTRGIVDFTRGDVRRQLFAFSLPFFLSNLLQIAYNMADMAIVGRVLGKEGLSAVSIGGDVQHFLTFLAMGFSNAGQVIFAQYIGAGRKEDVGRQYLPIAVLAFYGAALRSPMNALLNGSGNYRVNFATPVQSRNHPGLADSPSRHSPFF